MIKVRKEVGNSFVVCGEIKARDIAGSSIDTYMMRTYGAKRTKLYHTGVIRYKNLETGERYKIW